MCVHVRVVKLSPGFWATAAAVPAWTRACSSWLELRLAVQLGVSCTGLQHFLLRGAELRFPYRTHSDNSSHHQTHRAQDAFIPQHVYNDESSICLLAHSEQRHLTGVRHERINHRPVGRSTTARSTLPAHIHIQPQHFHLEASPTHKHSHTMCNAHPHANQDTLSGLSVDTLAATTPRA